jgi:hypothetical protein
MKSFATITFLNIITVVNLIDTSLDISFMILVYFSKVLWLVIPVSLSFIFNLCEKLYSIKKLLDISKAQYTNRFEKTVLEDPTKAKAFYSSNIAID